MSKFMRTALLVAMGVVCVGSVAFASVPDPTQSQCMNNIAYGPSGFIVLQVNVKNQTGANIVGSNVVIDFGTNPVAWCANQAAGVTRVGNTAAAVTDGSGVASFPLRAGGCSNTSVIKVYADGVQLCSFTIGTSPDMDGNLLVNVADLGAWAFAQASSPQGLCGDYDGNALVNVADLGTWALGQAAGGCP